MPGPCQILARKTRFGVLTKPELETREPDLCNATNPVEMLAHVCENGHQTWADPDPDLKLPFCVSDIKRSLYI